MLAHAFLSVAAELKVGLPMRAQKIKTTLSRDGLLEDESIIGFLAFVDLLRLS
jgi:hypothetical protein